MTSLRLVVALGDQHRDVVVAVDDPDATMADLAEALGVPGSETPRGDRADLDDGPWVDGRPVAWTTPLRDAGLHDGAVLARAPAPSPGSPTPGPTTAWITIVAGAGTGRRVPLARGGSIVVGRRNDCDLVITSATVSQRHATVTMDDSGAIVVEDLDSHNGTWIDGRSIHTPTRVDVGTTIRTGAAVLLVTGKDPADRPAGRPASPGLAGRVPFNRPPRPAPAAAVPPPAAPGRIEATATARGFRLAALVGPVLMGAFMVLRTGNVLYAGFAVISPLALVATWLAERRRAGREARHLDSSHARALDAWAADLHAAWVAARRVAEQQAPPLAEILRRAEAPSTRLWERRLADPDALRVRVGSTDLPWQAVPPAIDPASATAQEPDQGAVPTEAEEVIRAYAVLPDVPLTIDLGPRPEGSADDPAAATASRAQPGVVGIVGQPEGARALARALLLQATVLHGPADLLVGVFASPESTSWDWAKWLPHTFLPDGRTQLVANRSDVARRLAEDLLSGPDEASGTRSGGAMPLLVVDDLALLDGRSAAVRQLLAGAAGPVAGLVLAPSAAQLPASCRVVVELMDPVVATVRWPADGRRVTNVVTAPLGIATARRAARSMARWDDPDLPDVGGGLPGLVRLPDVLGIEDVDPGIVARRWAAGAADPGAPATLAATADGPLTIDLAHDGPHALVGGTTGSGKSELLRSLIASMAVEVDPAHLVFVLLDYKGGAAFDACADLPHTVGLVTDLDEHLARRALCSLDAELRHRELVLRDAGATDLPAYLHGGAVGGPLPRLVVVVDEYAALAGELPDFLAALVDVAQRGRSLGVHLVLATQRPRGVIDATMRDNIDLRIALRVQDAASSIDILDVPDAAALPRDRPGRAWIRRGHGDLVQVQTALAALPSHSDRAAVRVGRLRFAPRSRPPDAVGSGPRDLDRIVAACRAAFDQSGAPPPRRPWLPMPPDRLALGSLLTDPRAVEVPVVLALEDVPEEQDQRPTGWDWARGHLALVGRMGRGTTTALVAVATSIATAHGPETVHVHAIDFDGDGLAGLVDLPHVGAVVTSDEHERQARLVAMLVTQVAARRAMGAAVRDRLPRLVVLVDKLANFLAEHDDVAGRAVTDGFERVFREGPGVGIVMAVTAEQPRDVPTRLAGTIDTWWSFGAIDDASVPGRARDLPVLSPGRAWDRATGHLVQVGVPPSPSELADRWPGPVEHVPDAVAVLPPCIPADRVAPTPTTGRRLRIPVGVAADDLAPTSLDLAAGTHVLVAGPPRSGRTNALQLVSAHLRTMRPDARQLAVCEPDRSSLAGYGALDGSGTLDQLAPWLHAAIEDDGEWFVLVDDAGVHAESDLLARLVAARSDLHVVAAGRTSAVRGGYGSWLRSLAASRVGILLQPDLPGDGDLLATHLPRRTSTPLVTGRGWVVSEGRATLAQTFRRPPTPPPGGLAAPAEQGP